MRQHNIWCVRVRASCVERYAGLQSGVPLHTGRTHTRQTLCCRITTLTFYIFNKFLNQ